MRQTKVYIKRGHLQHEAPDVPTPDEDQVKDREMDDQVAAATAVAPTTEAPPDTGLRN